MAWLTGIQDLKIRLSDGPTDRYNFRKRCFGEINGSNIYFKTFDFRRITDFTATEGVFINGTIQSISAIASDNPYTGVFSLSTPPIDGSIVEASYYIRWFLDAELTDFLVQSSRIMVSSDDFTTLPLGLAPAAIEYAAGQAYYKMAERWRLAVSSGYKVEDAPRPDADTPVESFTKLGDAALKKVDDMMTLFYTRQRRNKQPLFGVAPGTLRSMP